MVTKEKKDKEDSPDVVATNNNPLIYKSDFETIYDIIANRKRRAMNVIHNESLLMLWEVGAFVSDRLKRAVWGDGVVRMLADYIRTRDPKAKGWSYSTIYRMVRFYDTYSSEEFTQIVNRYGMQNYLAETENKKLASVNGEIVSIGLTQRGEDKIVPIELAQLNDNVIVSFEMTQIPSVLFATGWTNHQIIMNRCKNHSERLFYMLYAGKQQLSNKELIRVIKTNTMNSLLGGKMQSEMMKRNYEIRVIHPIRRRRKNGCLSRCSLAGRGFRSLTAFACGMVRAAEKRGVLTAKQSVTVVGTCRRHDTRRQAQITPHKRSAVWGWRMWRWNACRMHATTRQLLETEW